MGCVPIQLYLWILKFEFQITVLGHILLFFPPFKHVNAHGRPDRACGLQACGRRDRLRPCWANPGDPVPSAPISHCSETCPLRPSHTRVTPPNAEHARPPGLCSCSSLCLECSSPALLSPSQPCPNVNTWWFYPLFPPTFGQMNRSRPKVLQHFSYWSYFSSSWVDLPSLIRNSLRGSIHQQQWRQWRWWRWGRQAPFTVLSQIRFHSSLSNKHFTDEHPEDQEESVTCPRLPRHTNGTARIWKHIFRYRQFSFSCYTIILWKPRLLKLLT